MSYQAYLDNINKKTGKSPADFLKLADKRGLLQPGVKAGAVVAWLKKDFDLGHGHAMALYGVIKASTAPRRTLKEDIDAHFAGRRAGWRKPYDQLISKLEKFGADVSVDPTSSYLSILRNGKKFAIVQVSGERLDIGIKLKGLDADKRLKAAGKWNTMVTHRVAIEIPRNMDAELLRWLRVAYDRVDVI